MVLVGEESGERNLEKSLLTGLYLLRTLSPLSSDPQSLSSDMNI